MSFGRWLLVHSFSLLLLALLILMYIFRSELQLEKAYHQLIRLKPALPVKVESETTTRKPPPKVGAIPQQKKTNKPHPQKTPELKPQPAPENSEPAHDKLVAVPTLKQSEPLNSQLDGDLIRARKAYWANDYARAIDEYQRLIKRHPQNPDYLGELGNIYYTLNNDQHAAELYFQAAMLFLQQNNAQQARSLLAPITALNRELGERLQKQLNR